MSLYHSASLSLSLCPTPPSLSTAGGEISTQLKQAFLPVVDHETCSSGSWWGSTVQDTMVCAGGGSDSGCNVRTTTLKCLY